VKKFISIISLVAILAMSLSFTALAAENTNEFSISTDVSSVKSGDSVIVEVDLKGDFTDVAMVQFAIKYDNTKFSTVTSGRAPWGFDKDWYNSTKDGNTENLGYINTPSMGENPAGQINVLFVSADGYYIDDGGDLYGDGKETVAGKIKFTATADVDVIDASCFELINVKVEDYNGTPHTVTANQIEAAAPAPSVNTVAAAETIKTDVMTSQEPAGYEKGQGFALRFAAGDVANFTKMIWALTVDGAKKYSDAVAFNAAAIADDAQVEVAATFLNQNEAAVSAVNAIFCTEDGTEYFTDAADADNKAE